MEPFDVQPVREPRRPGSLPIGVPGRVASRATRPSPLATCRVAARTGCSPPVIMAATAIPCDRYDAEAVSDEAVSGWRSGRRVLDGRSGRGQQLRVDRAAN